MEHTRNVSNPDQRFYNFPQNPLDSFQIKSDLLVENLA